MHDCPQQTPLQRISPAVSAASDRLVTRLTAGLTPGDLRDLARDDPPRQPNPRLRMHQESFWLNIKPAYYHAAATKFTHTFRLGLLSTYLFGVEIVTGVLLMVFYAPTPERAYGDVLWLTSRVPFGQLTRDMHRLAAEAMVIVVVLHMLRTFLTGSYKKPRQFTWLTGVVLLLATLLLSFSGYLLPYDQLAYWAVTIGSSMADKIPPASLGATVKLLLLGAPSVGPATLLRFYLLHVLFLPLALTFVFFIHYYKVVHFGISLPSSEEEIGQDTARRVPAQRRRAYLPDVLSDEIAFLGLVTLVLLALLVFQVYPGAPLEHHANPLKTPTHTEAPWYFLWVQGLLKLGDATLMGVLLPSALFLLLFLLPYIDLNPSRRAADRRVAIYLVMLLSATLVVLTWMGTAQYGVPLAPAEAVAQRVLPEEGAGLVGNLSWEALQPGDWDTRTYRLSTANPELRQALAQLAQWIAVEHDAASAAGGEGLPAGYAKLAVEQWQPATRKVTLRVFWQAENGQWRVLERAGFVAQAAAGRG
ncbi:MAG TPA: cytochrome b N-terminal domain-containing protein [Anaerolineae bacterium]|nr:cytochrome b N-terminal domain-containing protein [Anaerolineae bacterium]